MPWALSSIQWSGLPFFRESMQGVSALEMALYSSSAISPQPSRTTTRRGFSGFFIFGLGSSLKELLFVMVPIAPEAYLAPYSASGSLFDNRDCASNKCSKSRAIRCYDA